MTETVKLGEGGSLWQNPTKGKGGGTCACVVCPKLPNCYTQVRKWAHSRSYLSKSNASRRLTDSALFL
ncbi:hypothetical protein TYRP_019376 [Tyrophagus putrescentiae]|nr:hypothetical protein TYRP_019376 [Tyrophagus putrescentiae]